MTPNDFCLWLRGYVELGGGTPTDAQWEVIKDHLQLVMDKKTPVRNIETDNLMKLVPDPQPLKDFLHPWRDDQTVKDFMWPPYSDSLKITC